MITGSLNGDLTPYVRLKVRGPLGDEAMINFLLDTGFNGQVSLPSSWIGTLSLLYIGRDYVILADGTMSEVEMYEVVMDWDGQERKVLVTLLEDEPLLGTALLWDHDLYIHFVNGGPVTLQRKP